MSEIEDVLALYGAIDRAVGGDSSLLGEVAVMLPGYQQEIIGGEAHTGWFDRFLEAVTLVNGGDPTQGLGPPASSLSRSLDDALGGLSDVPPRGRLGVRRLIALATLARIRERLDPVPSPGALSTALGLGAIGSDLLPALAAAREVPQILDLVPTSIMSSEERMLSSQSSPVCDGKWWVAPDSSSVPVARLRTEFQVPKTKTLTYAKLTKFLDPALWPANHPFWCCMAAQGKTAKGTLYHEKVSFDCARPGSVWGTSVLLEFRRTDYKKTGSAPRRSRVHYDLASKPTDTDTVQVDVGDIIVIDAPRGFVTIETTKRLGFHPPTATPSLAEGLCYAGYWDAVHDLVLRCASPGTTAPFPTDCS